MWHPRKYAISFPRKSLNQKMGVKGDFLSKTVELASIRDQKQLFCVGFLKIYFKNILFLKRVQRISFILGLE